jgi:hypothetical protein
MPLPGQERRHHRNRTATTLIYHMLIIYVGTDNQHRGYRRADPTLDGRRTGQLRCHGMPLTA